MAAPVAFVGRRSELSRLLEALGGETRLVLVVGDAGVGKTRFAEQVMARATAAGTLMARGECLSRPSPHPTAPRRGSLAGAADPEAWRRAAKSWDELGCPHRAGYAWWRQAQAQLDAGQPATAAATALWAAEAAADGHAPLLAQIRQLAERARIPLRSPSAEASQARPTAVPQAYGLTDRELAVLRLLAAGRTNAQIGAELYISPKTASVHVSSIFRKLGVSSRVQAASLAERAGLLAPESS